MWFNYKIDITVGDTPLTRGARASAAMILTYLSWYISVSAPAVLNFSDFDIYTDEFYHIHLQQRSFS